MEALEKAAKTRAERTGIKRAVKAGELDPLEAMELPVMQRCLARAFLESLPGIGVAKAAKLMERFGISPRRRVSGLGRHQREEIIDYLKERYGVRGVPAE